jgi:hypothetical protein
LRPAPVQRPEAGAAPYCVGGPYGRLLDAEAEHLGRRRCRRSRPRADRHRRGARRARLSLPPHRGPPRRIADPLIIDEGWLALDDEGFAGQLREWLKTLRKKNASVIFATQSLSDIDGSAIAPAIIESCQTRLLLPNERAIEPQITAIYRRFGLNDRQIEIIARAMPKRDYYCQSRRGNRLFELGLSDVALALCAASAKTDQPRSPLSPSTARRLPRRLAAPSRRRLGRRPHSQPHPRRNCHDLASLPRGSPPRCSSPLSRSRPCWRRPRQAQWTCSTRPTMRRTC